MIDNDKGETPNQDEIETVGDAAGIPFLTPEQLEALKKTDVKFAQSSKDLVKALGPQFVFDENSEQSRALRNGVTVRLNYKPVTPKTDEELAAIEALPDNDFRTLNPKKAGFSEDEIAFFESNGYVFGLVEVWGCPKNIPPGCGWPVANVAAYAKEVPFDEFSSAESNDDNLLCEAFFKDERQGLIRRLPCKGHFLTEEFTRFKVLKQSMGTALFEDGKPIKYEGKPLPEPKVELTPVPENCLAACIDLGVRWTAFINGLGLRLQITEETKQEYAEGLCVLGYSGPKIYYHSAYLEEDFALPAVWLWQEYFYEMPEQARILRVENAQKAREFFARFSKIAELEKQIAALKAMTLNSSVQPNSRLSILAERVLKSL